MSAASGASPPSASVKLALCQMDVTGMHPTGSKDENLRVAADALRTAASNGAHLAVLPEFFTCPYDDSGFFCAAEAIPEVGHSVASPTSSPSVHMLCETARTTGMTIIGGSIPEIGEPEKGDDSKAYSTSITVDPAGNVVAKHRKLHLFHDHSGVFRFIGPSKLSAGDSPTAFEMTLPGGGSMRVGVGIGHDVRYPELAAIAAREAGAQLIVYPAVFDMTYGPADWELLLRSRALDNQVYVAGCSPARNSTMAGFKAWGLSTIVDPQGKVVAKLDKKAGIVYGDICLEKIAQVREAVPTSMQRRNDIYRLSSV